MASGAKNSALSRAEDPRPSRSREALRDALFELLESNPLDHVSIRDITKKAGIGYTTFYRYYSSKEELLDDLAADEIRHLVSLSIPVMDAKNSRAACLALCEYIDQHRTLWTTLLTGGAADALRRELHNLAVEAAATRYKQLRWLPKELGITLAVSAQMDILTWWLSQPDPLPAKQVAVILDRVVIAPTVLKK